MLLRATVEHSTPVSGIRGRRGITRLLFSRPALFFVFGGIAAVVNLATGWLLYGTGMAPGLPYWCATGIAAGTGLVVNFGLNHSFNFRFRQRAAIGQFGTFCIVSGIGVVLTSGLSSVFRWALENQAGQHLHLYGAAVSASFAAHFLAVGVVAFYSYPAHRYLSFNVGIGARLRQARAVLVRCE